jgi:catechol 2,3-dioxygenase-like lactoylglutathione lyase family enzyme
MAILGIESLVYGVDDVALNARFWSDFGLTPLQQEARQSVFEVASGSRVIVRAHDDPTLPQASFSGQGLREAVWGVDTPESLERLVVGLSTDREVRRDADGSAHFQADDGTPLGLRVWHKRPVVSQPDPVNAPGNIQRLNLHRKWRMHARPKTINHVVYFADDYVASIEFYRDRLNFRISDHFKGVGAFARADGTNEHHSVFLFTTDLPNTRGKRGYIHAAFGVEDIDELMLGAGQMEKRGWLPDRAARGGLSRHRASSALYYYIKCPAGGEAEYHADTDYLDDNWIPRVWGWHFGALLWSHHTPPHLKVDEPDWDIQLDPELRSLAQYRKQAAGKPR